MKFCKFTIITVSAFLLGVSCSEKPDQPVPTEPVAYSDYRILYQMTDKEDSVSMSLAYDIQKTIKKCFDVDVKVFAANKVSSVEKEIIIGRTDKDYAQEFYDENNDDFAYRIQFKNKKIFVAAGGSWALEAACECFKTDVLEVNLPYQEGNYIEGNIRGKMLFPKTAGANLRILDDNIWQYDSKTNPAAWKNLGANCTNQVRSQNYSALLKAYQPDIVCLQEFSNDMKTYLEPTLNSLGMVIVGSEKLNNTPIYYNTSILELKTFQYKQYGNFTPTGGSEIQPGTSKSYTLSVFKHKPTSKEFMMVCTHLWWKTNSAQAGSDLCREAEVRTLMAAISDMLKVYDVPVFVVGDMNCKLASTAMKQFTNAGYQPLVTVATDFADGSSGYHSCDASGFQREKNHNLNGGGSDCIDQFFLYNDKDAVAVKWFERIHAYFTIKLTDHYPNFTDITL